VAGGLTGAGAANVGRTMGWKDLFKGKGARRKPDPQVRWFGKLPTYADYYSSAADADWVLEYNDWLLKGCELFYARRRSHGVEARLPAGACAVRMPKSQMVVLAALLDYGGDMRGRPFPLSFYVGVPAEIWPGLTAQSVLPVLRVLSELIGLREQVNRFFKAPARFEAVFGGRELDLSTVCGEVEAESWEVAAGRVSLAEWFALAGPVLRAQSVEAWIGALDAWGARLAQLNDEETGPTLRLPIVSRLPTEPQIAGWVSWVERRVNLDRWPVSLLATIDPQEATGGVTLVCRDVVAEDFLLLTPLRGTLAYVDDASQVTGDVVPGGDADAALGEGRSSVRAPATWRDFAARSTHVGLEG